MDKADENVGDDVGGPRFDIGPIGLIGPILLGPEPHELRFPAVLVPKLLLPHSQEVAVVLEQLLQARASHVE